MKELENVHWHHSAGREFQEAFYILIADFDPINITWRKQVERPSYYCAGLAIEHFLKGYLYLEKIEFPAKSHKGHDLDNLISLGGQQLKDFFELDNIDTQQILILNERYYGNEFLGKDDLRYASKSGIRKSPHPDNLNRIIKKIETKLMARILGLYKV